MSTVPARSRATQANVRRDRATGPSRREAILRAALDCFLERSVAAATIEDVREHSGASVGSIYHHFGSKEGLATALYLDILRSYHDAYLDVLEHSSSAREGVEGSVRHHLRWVANDPARARYLFHCREPEIISRSRVAAAEVRSRFFADAGRWVDGHVAAGEIKSLPPAVCQALWMGPVVEFARTWLAGQARPGDLEAAETPLATAAWTAIRAS